MSTDTDIENHGRGGGGRIVHISTDTVTERNTEGRIIPMMQYRGTTRIILAQLATKFPKVGILDKW